MRRTDNHTLSRCFEDVFIQALFITEENETDLRSGQNAIKIKRSVFSFKLIDDIFIHRVNTTQFLKRNFLVRLNTYFLKRPGWFTESEQ